MPRLSRNGLPRSVLTEPAASTPPERRREAPPAPSAPDRDTSKHILLDLFGLGHPDLLTGSKEWRKNRSEPRRPSAYREFDMNLIASRRAAPQFWEWVGPKSGILVYWPDDTPTEFPVRLDGASLFGNHTFGRVGDDAWDHGYQPLATLDQNGDGRLTDSELDSVWVWLDLNGNAVVDEGEMKPASDYVRWISTIADVDADGNAEAPVGAELLDGTKISSWDWWSMHWGISITDRVGSKDGFRYVEQRSTLLEIRDIETSPSLYFWQVSTLPHVSGFL